MKLVLFLGVETNNLKQLIALRIWKDSKNQFVNHVGYVAKHVEELSKSAEKKQEASCGKWEATDANNGPGITSLEEQRECPTTPLSIERSLVINIVIPQRTLQRKQLQTLQRKHEIILNEQIRNRIYLSLQFPLLFIH